MIPVKLTIQGLYSYQEKQVVDFSKLTSAHLFGIFGSVGSGKSSILEAITFAIYGETDRLNARDGRNYNMMNLKSSDLLIEFDFETGKEQTAYKAVVKGRRNSKRFDDVKTLDRTAYRKEQGVWVPVEPDTLNEAIGLSYENFKRTIIIPQGQFQEFLQLGNKERTQMMKALFNLEKFELDGKAASLESKNNALRQNLEGQLQQLGTVDPEQLIVFQEKIEQLKVEIAGLSLTIQNFQKQDLAMNKLRDLFGTKEKLLAKLADFARLLPEIEKQEKALAEYEYCVVQFKNLFEALESSSARVQSLTKRISEGNLKYSQAQEIVRSLESQFAQAKLAFDSRELLKEQASELEKIIRLKEIILKLSEQEERIVKGEKVVADTEKGIDLLRLENEKIIAQLKTAKSAMPDMLALSEAKSWHDAQIGYIQQLNTINLETEKCQVELLGCDEMVNQILADPLFLAFAADKNQEGISIFLKEKRELFKSKLSVLDREIQHLKVQQKLEEFAIGLNDGEACPVCGSLHHPKLLTGEQVAEDLRRAEKERFETEQQINRIVELMERLAGINNQSVVLHKQLASIQERKKELDLKMADHAGKFMWEKYRQADEVRRAFEQAAVWQKNIDALEKQRDQQAREYEQKLLAREKYRQEIEKIRNDVASLKGETGTLKTQVKILDLNVYLNKTRSELELELNALLKRYAEVELAFNNVNLKLQEQQKSRDVLRGTIAANQLQLEQEKAHFAATEEKLKMELNASDFESREAVSEILKQHHDLAGEKLKISQFRQDMSVAQKQMEQLVVEIGSQNYDANEHRKLSEDLVAGTQELNRKNQKIGVATKAIEDLRKSLGKQAELRQKLSALELRAENIKTMRSLFKASGFVNYVSSVYLQNLCNAANDRFFRLTRQKLSLEITEDNSFQVRDYLNGGMVRSVKTLSGGQTFQAALCLALALADNIQRITESNQNFFFLDEGFGSLDKESLSVVFDALKSLRKENRIVGVISHVEEMQQEIDTHLWIENRAERGSIIRASWSS